VFSSQLQKMQSADAKSTPEASPKSSATVADAAAVAGSTNSVNAPASSSTSTEAAGDNAAGLPVVWSISVPAGAGPAVLAAAVAAASGAASEAKGTGDAGGGEGKGEGEADEDGEGEADEDGEGGEGGGQDQDKGEEHDDICVDCKREIVIKQHLNRVLEGPFLDRIDERIADQLSGRLTGVRQRITNVADEAAELKRQHFFLRRKIRRVRRDHERAIEDLKDNAATTRIAVAAIAGVLLVVMLLANSAAAAWFHSTR
jgi:hypothetical protein